jgi:acetolactate synthase-1/3 small subunit
MSEGVEKRWNFVVVVDNEPGVLSGISGMFSARGYNIDSLTVCSVDNDHSCSRMNIVTRADERLARQIMAQIKRLIPVRRVDILEDGREGFVAKEVALVRVVSEGANRREALRIATIFDAKASDTTLTSFVFVVQGGSGKVDAFVSLMRSLGEVEVARSGVVAIHRGSEIPGM